MRYCLVVLGSCCLVLLLLLLLLLLLAKHALPLQCQAIAQLHLSHDALPPVRARKFQVSEHG